MSLQFDVESDGQSICRNCHKSFYNKKALRNHMEFYHDLNLSSENDYGNESTHDQARMLFELFSFCNNNIPKSKDTSRDFAYTFFMGDFHPLKPLQLRPSAC